MILSLRPYQKADVEKLCKFKCTACFNEQRTGKTPVAICTMQSRGLDKILVVCPSSMLYPWATAWQTWANKTAIICNGTPEKRKRLIESWEHGPLIISYDSLKATATSDGAIEYILNKNPDGCIADEAHRFKNPKTATAKAMYRLIKIPYRLALTGTPATNQPIDIYGILHWLYPEIYTGYWKFAQENFRVYDSFTGFGRSHKEIGDWLPGRKELLASQLEEFTTQRKRKDVMPWLPDKTYMDIHLQPTKRQLKYLNELEEYFETEDVITQGVLDRLLRVRQICAAPATLNLKGNSPKLDWIISYLKDYPNRHVLIFSKFVSVINILKDMLDTNQIKKEIITGETKAEDRAQHVYDFQQGLYNVLVLQIDAGKEGLTLDRAEDIIFIDQFPPAADIQQAEDRFVATTEDKAQKDHTIIRLMLDDTYDIQLYKLVTKRANSIAVVNDYIKYIRKEK